MAQPCELTTGQKRAVAINCFGAPIWQDVASISARTQFTKLWRNTGSITQNLFHVSYRVLRPVTLLDSRAVAAEKYSSI